jgi:amino acid adenylation domain-containing protein
MGSLRFFNMNERVDFSKQLNYWKARLAGYQPFNLPTDHARPTAIDRRSTQQEFALNKELSKKLKAFAQDYGVTLNSVMLSSITILLGKYTGQDDIAIGMNRVVLNKFQSYKELIKQVHHDLVEAELYQDLPFEKLAEELGAERDASGHPVFQVMLEVQDFDNQNKSIVHQSAEKFDICIFINDNEEELTGCIHYATGLFHKDTIARLIHHYQYLLEQLTQAADKPYSQLSLLNPTEYKQIMYDWNATDKEHTNDATICELVEEQVKKTPDNIALVYDGHQLTYKELNEKSNQLARYISAQYKQRTKQSLAPDTLIALCLDRSLEMVIGILAVLKAGGAYVPMDMTYPQERIDYMLQDTKAALILSQQHLSESSNTELPKDKVIYIDLAASLYKEEDRSDLPRHSKDSDLAYVIYTSGTTGKPKGVMVEQKSVINLVNDLQKRYDIESSERCLLFANYIFDASVEQLYLALLSGATLFVIDNKSIIDSNRFTNFVADNRITHIHATPSYLSTIDPAKLNVVKRVVFGAELLSENLFANYKKNIPTVLNEYGPTETTVTALVSVNSHLLDKASIQNTKAYILDQHNIPVPTGIIGELHIGGAGLARGYLNRADLTEERFIENPFATDADKVKGYTRLYKTGDLVKWLRDGKIAYIGRNDDQVKIRGYRIELGEIESALSQIAGIKQSCVLAKEKKTGSGSNNYLVGYYVLDGTYISENEADILDGWETFYDVDYEKDLKEIKMESDFSGWNSYVTGKPIPLPEMEEWRNDIVTLINSLRPCSVLEIGVGSGLLMYPLLNTIQKYTGVDISRQVINRHIKYLENKKQPVELYHLRADQIDQLPKDELYDTIIINSVCQCFPNIKYFENMLEKAIEKLTDTGSFFIGDVRNYDSHKEIIKEKLDFEGKAYTSQDIDRIALKVDQLLISPDYFINFKNRYGTIEVDILERSSGYSNELSKYRYDVVITNKQKKKINGSSKTVKNDPDLTLIKELAGTHNIPYLNQLSKEQIFKKLSTVLPSYMMPSALEVMESFPLTSNGKLDKRALPDPDFGSSSDYSSPTTAMEADVCKIWQEILGLGLVGISDDFFKIGGNSILATLVANRMSKACDFEINVADVFHYRTISRLLTSGNRKTLTSIPRIAADQAILSSAQERLWFIEQYEAGTNAYHIPEIYELDVDTNVKGIKHALQQIVSRHEVLRSTIIQGDDQGLGMQVVQTDPLSVEEVAVTNLEDFKSLIKADINRPFDLSREYPIRTKLYVVQSAGAVPTQEKSRIFLLINTHQITTDGWSSEIFHKELFACYEAYVKNDINFKLPALEIQYKDYAVWQRSYLSGSLLEKQLKYWKEKLAGYQTLELPKDYSRPAETDYKGAIYEFRLNREVSRKLRTLSQDHGVTLHSVMLSSMNILLNKYTGQDDIMVGSPIANRHHRQTEELIGFFVNAQVNRTLLKNDQSFETLIQQVHQEQVEAQKYQDLPFEKLVSELGVERDPSRHPLFQVWFVVQSFGNQGKFNEQQKKYLLPFPIEDAHEAEKFDLSIFINDGEEEFTGYISYATSLFHRNTIERFFNHYAFLLDQLTQAPGKPYSQMSLLDAKEYKQIVYNWNATDKEYPKDKTIHELFEEQVKRTPDNIAIVYEEQQLTYTELHEKSNQLAHYISAHYKERTKRSLAPDTLIALCLDRSLEMVIGILAVLKAGSAYVPVDPFYPQERIDYMLQDSKTEIVLTQRHINEGSKIELPQDMIIHIDLTEAFYKKEATSTLTSQSKATHLAYVIYTSGTTGKPKGVMVEHRSALNTIHALCAVYDIKKIKKVSAYTSYVFDVSVSELFNSLLQGLELHILTNAIRADGVALSTYFTTNKINLVYLPPVLLSQLPEKPYPDLNSLIYAGEPCDKQTVKLWSAKVKLFNYYGPTELSIYATGKQLFTDEAEQIGKPIENTKAYVLDNNNSPVPIGVIGELYISGAGMARGYLNRPDLTNERFVPNSFASEADKAKGYSRLYKTGDLVRWLPDGNLEYIGRNDDQVKIRGYRIELGEIENALLQLAGIKQSCVLAKERKTEAGSSKYIVAYYVADGSAGTLTQTILAEKLAQVVPEYMMPSAFVAMESFPFTINGKLDKGALPDPDLSTSAEEYVPPVTETETMLSKIWQGVLGIDRIGITDNFFRVGGNSILAIQLSHQMSKALGRDVKVADIFKLKNIKMLSATVACVQVDPENVEWEFN